MPTLDPEKILLLLCKVLSPHMNKVLWETPPPEGKPVRDADKIEIAADLADMGKTPDGRKELSVIRDEICDRIKTDYKFNCTLGVGELSDGSNSFGLTLGDLRDYIIAISTPIPKPIPKK